MTVFRDVPANSQQILCAQQWVAAIVGTQLLGCLSLETCHQNVCNRESATAGSCLPADFTEPRFLPGHNIPPISTHAQVVQSDFGLISRASPPWPS